MMLLLLFFLLADLMKLRLRESLMLNTILSKRHLLLELEIQIYHELQIMFMPIFVFQIKIIIFIKIIHFT